MSIGAAVAGGGQLLCCNTTDCTIESCAYNSGLPTGIMDSLLWSMKSATSWSSVPAWTLVSRRPSTCAASLATPLVVLVNDSSMGAALNVTVCSKAQRTD